MSTAFATTPATPTRRFFALLGKDWRLCRTPVVATLVALFIPLLATVIATGVNRHLPAAGDAKAIVQFREELAASVFAGFHLALIAVPAVAACAMARERRDRSAVFLHTLPVGRPALLASKACVSIGWTVVLWLLAGAIVWTLSPITPDFTREEGTARWLYLGLLIAVNVAFIGLAWFFGAVLASETIVTGIVLGLVTVIFLTALAVLHHLELRGLISELKRDDDTWTRYMRTVLWCLVPLGLASFAAGSAIFLRRRGS